MTHLYTSYFGAHHATRVLTGSQSIVDWGIKKDEQTLRNRRPTKQTPHVHSAEYLVLFRELEWVGNGWYSMFLSRLPCVSCSNLLFDHLVRDGLWCGSNLYVFPCHA
jgi:hypothetical protein